MKRPWALMLVVIAVLAQDWSLQMQIVHLRKSINMLVSLQDRTVTALGSNAESIKLIADTSAMHSAAIQQLADETNKHTRDIHGLIRVMYVIYHNKGK